MARLPDVQYDNIAKPFRPKGSGWYVQQQQRIYNRQRGQFVGIGFILTLSRYVYPSRQENNIVILDEQLTNYF